MDKIFESTIGFDVLLVIMVIARGPKNQSLSNLKEGYLYLEYK